MQGSAHYVVGVGGYVHRTQSATLGRYSVGVQLVITGVLRFDDSIACLDIPGGSSGGAVDATASTASSAAADAVAAPGGATAMVSLLARAKWRRTRLRWPRWTHRQVWLWVRLPMGRLVLLVRSLVSSTEVLLAVSLSFVQAVVALHCWVIRFQVGLLRMGDFCCRGSVLVQQRKRTGLLLGTMLVPAAAGVWPLCTSGVHYSGVRSCFSVLV